MRIPSDDKNRLDKLKELKELEKEVRNRMKNLSRLSKEYRKYEKVRDEIVYYKIRLSNPKTVEYKTQGQWKVD